MIGWSAPFAGVEVITMLEPVSSSGIFVVVGLSKVLAFGSVSPEGMFSASGIARVFAGRGD